MSHEAANKATTNNIVLFLFSDLKYLGQERKNILHQYLFEDKIIQNCLKIDANF